MLYADDATVVSRSPASLAKMMTAVVEVCGAYGLRNTDDGHASTTPRTRGSRDSGRWPAICPNRAVRIPGWYHHDRGRYERREQACFTAMPTLSTTDPPRWRGECSKRSFRDALLYGCSTWTLLTREYGLLRIQHHRLILRCVGFRKRQRSDQPLSYAATLAKTGCESVK